MLDVIMVGAGGFGREVYCWARALFCGANYRFKGFIDDNPELLNSSNRQLNILGTIASGEHQYRISDTDRFIYCIGNIDGKKEIIEGLQSRGAKFISLVHPTAMVADTASIGKGVVVCPFAIISDQTVISDFVLINFFASCAHDTRLGKYCILSPYATLNGYAQLEEEVFLGTRATVLSGLKIGCRSKLSAHSAATTNVPPRSIVFNAPSQQKQIFF